MNTNQSMVDHSPSASVVTTGNAWYVAFEVFVGDIIVTRTLMLAQNSEHAREVANVYNKPLGLPAVY